jgi:hypothetical protein
MGELLRRANLELGGAVPQRVPQPGTVTMSCYNISVYWFHRKQTNDLAIYFALFIQHTSSLAI